MKQIQLTQGKFASVDDEDYEQFSKHKWCAHRNRSGIFYAIGKSGRNAMHRVVIGAERQQLVDHRNGNGLDNRRSNLRLCTHSQNNQNKISKRKSTSKFKGVSWFKPTKKWIVHICLNKDKHIGCFDNEIVAAKAYDIEAIKLFGEFALLNFPKATNV